MKRFFRDIITFFGFLFLIIAIGWFIPSKWIAESLHYAIFDKHQLLQSSKNEPKRIILVGGSNVSFGTYAPLIEDSLGIPTINTAIHAAYGLKFILDDITPFIQKGDIVIVSPEYAQFTKDQYLGADALIQLLNVYPKNFSYLNAKQWLIFLRTTPRHALVKIRFFLMALLKGKDETGVYLRKSFNKSGDVIAHWDQTPLPKGTPDVISTQFNSNAFDRLQIFKEEIEKRGATCIISPCTFRESSFEYNKAAIKLIEKELKKYNLTFVGKPVSYSLPDSLYFDSAYHPTKEGQLLRTEQLIKDIQTFIHKNNERNNP